MTWQEKVDAIKDDPEKVKQALLLYVLVKSHVDQCFHKRACTEQQLWAESQFALRLVTLE